MTRRALLGGVTGALGLAAVGIGTAQAAPTASRGAGRLDRESYVALPVGRGGGPAETDAVRVLQVGPPAAETVLVLVPGQFGAANDFRLLARDLVAAVPGLQVWAFDRREQGLADLTGFTTPDPIGYYLDDHYRTQDPAASAFVADWGLARTLSDLRAVVHAAAAGGRRRVVLGGHSWGATTTLAYAAWDFGGRAGYRDLSGLVLIDGGVHGAFVGGGYDPDISPERVRERLTAVSAGAVFDMSLAATGLGSRAESSQIWYQLAGWYACRDPHARSVLQPRLPAHLTLPYPVTNAALLGTLVDESFGWPNDITVHSGHIAGSGAVRGWVNDGITPIERVAAAYAGPDPVVWEWYWPARLTVDLDVVDPYADTDLARSLGLRLGHTGELDVPLYAFETSASQGTVVSSTKWVVANSRVPSATYQTDNGMNHLDPLFASTSSNTFTHTVVPFLAQLAQGRAR
ncbi:hypothetical protein [Saccharothrix deserti]|uniref:hypothetical protein n=1 Tax=Saccharothrix deserti TaxID=2593674 RepID=UPI00192E59F6|nr:hypothetical protein [Saccharothrix deserti]